MKRILYLTFYFRPDLCAGSFRNTPLVDELIKQTQNSDIQIDVLTTSPNRYSSFRKEYLEKEVVKNVTIERIKVPSHQSGIKDQVFSFITYFFRTLFITRNQEYDLVFASSSRFFTSYLGYWIAKKNNSTLYLDIRDLFSETLQGISKSWFIRKMVVPLIQNREKKVFQYASHINLISEGFREDFPANATQIFSHFTHGVDPDFKFIDQANTEPKKKQVQTILYAGNIGEGQGLHKIIPEAANRLSSTHHFKIIGDGGAKHKLEQRLMELNVNNVTICDPITRKELIEEYKKADILFIHLNDYDIFKKVLPSKIFELAALEKPILAGVYGYARKFMIENVDGVFIFNPGNTDELVQKTIQINKKIEESLRIDNSRFAEAFDRKTINRDMAHSILQYL